MKEAIYIFSSGTLKRKQNTLYFKNKKDGKKFIPVEHTKEIFIFGEVNFNAKLLNFLSQKQIILHYFNYYDYYAGSFYPREHYNSGYMVIKQAKHYENTRKRLEIARQIVRGAIKNSLKNLKYYDRRGRKLKNTIEKIENFLKNVPGQKNIKGLMAVEGQVKKSYLHAFNKILSNEEFDFVKRTRRPPKDRINAVISFINSVIYTQVLSEIYQTHLDPRIGYLHSSNFRRFTLNLDIAEIFKPAIGDRVIFSIINKKRLLPENFDDSLRGIILNDEGRKIVLKYLERKLSQTIKHHSLKKKVSYRRLMRLELYKLEKHLMEEEKYKPFVMDW